MTETQQTILYMTISSLFQSGAKPKVFQILTEAKNPLKLFFGRSTRFCSFNEVCISSRKLSSKKSLSTWVYLQRISWSSWQARNPPTTECTWAQSPAVGEKALKTIRKSRTFHIPKLILAPPLHGLVPPGPEIWETAGLRALRKLWVTPLLLQPCL